MLKVKNFMLKVELFELYLVDKCLFSNIPKEEAYLVVQFYSTIAKDWYDNFMLPNHMLRAETCIVGEYSSATIFDKRLDTKASLNCSKSLNIGLKVGACYSVRLSYTCKCLRKRYV